MMDSIKLTKNYENFGEQHRFTYHEFSNNVEWEMRVPISFLRRIFNSSGPSYEWKRIYFGQITPVEKCLETFRAGTKLRDESQKF